MVINRLAEKEKKNWPFFITHSGHVEEETNKLLEMGLIRERNPPVFFVAKKSDTGADGKKAKSRLVIDFRRINKQIEDDSDSLP